VSDGWEQRVRAQRWLAPVDSLEEAARHVDNLGLVLLFPGERIQAPSLWEAVAGEDTVPFANGMGRDEARIWEWKDELPNAGLTWYGKFLHRRASLVSPDLLSALYPGRGKDTDHRTLDLSREAHEIAEALRGGPLTTAALRQLLGDKARYERAVGELHRQLLVTSAGVQRQGTGWPASVVELTCRQFTVGGSADPAYVSERYVDTMVVTTVREMARALGWPVPVVRQRLDALVASGVADRLSQDTYRAAGARPS
jgi:hypothetical protein